MLSTFANIELWVQNLSEIQIIALFVCIISFSYAFYAGYMSYLSITKYGW